MRRLAAVQFALGLFNAAAAAAVVYVTFAYFIAPAETEDLARLRAWKPKAAPVDAAAGKRTAASFRAAWETPLPVRYVPPAAPSAPPAPPEAPQGPDIAKLFSLTGTVATDDPRAGLAVLLELASKKTLLLAAEKPLPGTSARIVEIRKDHVVVASGTKTEKLFVKAEIPSAAPAPPGRTAPGAGGPPLPPPVVGPAVDPKTFRTQRDMTNPNLWNVDRNEKQYLMKSLPDLRNQVGVRPVMKDGAMNGVQIESIQPSSILSDRGISTGDIIRKINGIAITSQEQGDQLMANPNIRNAARYDLEIERAGQVFTITYQINR
jgi:type II secretion system protein C